MYKFTGSRLIIMTQGWNTCSAKFYMMKLLSESESITTVIHSLVQGGEVNLLTGTPHW